MRSFRPSRITPAGAACTGLCARRIRGCGARGASSPSPSAFGRSAARIVISSAPEAHALAADLAYGAGVAGTLLAADNATFLTVVAALALARGRSAGERALERTRAMVPRELVEGPRHLAAAIARRARDLSN